MAFSNLSMKGATPSPCGSRHRKPQFGSDHKHLARQRLTQFGIARNTLEVQEGEPGAD